ncbi:hypothetical protein JCM11641_005217 [Rhodosporidiobolus odoratus]
MRSVLAYSALSAAAASTVSALSYHSNNPLNHINKRHSNLAQAHHHNEQRDGSRMERKIRRQDGAAHLAASSTKASTSYSTTAIWYAEAGWITSCQETLSEDDYVVGLPLALYPDVNSKSDLCGEKVKVVNPASGESITATVIDASNRNDYTIFSSTAFTALGGDLETGELSITFSFADSSVSVPESSSTIETGSTSTSAGVAAEGSSSSAPSGSKTAPAAGGAASTISDDPSSSKDEAKVASTPAAVVKAAASITSAAPSTTEAPNTTPAQTTTTSSWDSDAYYASQASVSSASSADAAKAWEKSQQALAAASSSSSAAAYELWAASSSKAAASWASSSSAAADRAWVSSSSAAAAAAEASASAGSDGSSASAGSGSSSASGHVYTGGIATYFYQNGVAGNCGKVNSDSTPLVALPTNTYAGGKYCGQYVTIKRVDTGDTIKALVADSCPTCNNDNCLDLSWGAFSALGGTESMGVFDIQWWY